MNGTKLYTDISQLSLVAGCSLTDIVTALPNNSIAMLYTNNSDRLVNDVPYPYGCLHIFKKVANRVTCKFWSSRDSTSYERVYNAEFVSDWKQVISNADLDTWVSRQFAQQQTIAAKHWITVDTGVIIPSGKTYKVGVVIYTGNQFVFPMNVYMDSNRHIFAELSNVSDSQVTVQFAAIQVCYGI